MNEIETCIGKKFTITEKDLLQTVISVKGDRDTFPDEGPTTEDCQNLLKIPADDCSEETKKVIIQFMLKFGKLYKKDFQPLIERLRTFELENINEGYRDHVCHSFRVWCLGYWLYQKGFKCFFDAVGQSSDDFDFVWYLTAFYHDIGYIKEHRVHGGDSAQLLLKKLNSTFSGNWTINAIHAIVAICYHDRHEEVDISKDPYSALLIVCDELQEWGRNIPRNIPENIEKFEPDKFEFCLDLSNLQPSIEVVLFYRLQTKPVKELSDYVKRKEGKLNRKFSSRIKNLTIKVHCKTY